jgi:hypothetical protein
MAHYRRYDDAPRRHNRDWPDQVNDAARSWFNGNGSAHWGPRERGGYWRHYEHYVGRGPTNHHDVAERISDVRDVTKPLRVTRGGNGHYWAADSLRASGAGITSSQQVSEASGKGTPSKSTSGTSA